jgi:hypothetical protein
VNTNGPENEEGIGTIRDEILLHDIEMIKGGEIERLTAT